MLRRSFFTEFDIEQSKSCYKFLQKIINLDQKRILEIGAGGGALLKYISQFGSSSLFYSDLSKEACLHLSSHKGLHDLNDTADKKFDLVIMRHVLEHIFDLDGFFLYLKQLLKKNGNIFIEVPDWTILDINTDPLIFEHLNQFNVSGLVNLMSKHSFQVDSLEKSIEKKDPSTPNRVVRIIAHFSELPKLGSNEIKNYFEKFFNNYSEKWKFTLQKILKTYSNKKIALYPASSLTFDAIKSVDFSNVKILGMYDVDKKKQDKFFLGHKVFSPEKLLKHNPDLILTFSMGYEPEIRKSLIDMKLSAKILSIQELISS
jgi:SAM-dependent methyltransferase